MSGHSHWATVKRKKGAVDAKKGRLFSKLARAISAAARIGGGDPNANITLKYAVEAARSANMPKENIERAIKKGTGEIEGEVLEQLMYEGYGPGGVALMMEILTDNRNRTAAEIRKIFDMRGGNLAGAGSVAWMFEKKGLFVIDQNDAEEDTLMEIALEAGAEDMTVINGTYEIICSPADFESMRKALDENNIKADPAEISMIPGNTVELDLANARKVVALMEALEDHEDIQHVYSNFSLPPELMEELNK